MAAKSNKYVKVIDHGWDALKAELSKLPGSSVKVGIQSDAGAHKGEGSDADMVDIAIWNEFGTKRIPKRPAHSQAFDKHRSDMDAMIAAGYDAIITGRTTVEKALGLIGLKFTGLVQKQVRDFSDPPNAPATIAKKGVDNPLIDTGQMINSIRHVVDIRGGSLLQGARHFAAAKLARKSGTSKGVGKRRPKGFGKPKANP